MTEKEKRDFGEIYDANNDPELQEELLKAKDFCYEYNMIRPSDIAKKTELLNRIIGKTGENCTVMAPFWCDYG